MVVGEVVSSVSDDVVRSRYATRRHVSFVTHCHVVSVGWASILVQSVPLNVHPVIDMLFQESCILVK
jgi:hypothetical protein